MRRQKIGIISASYLPNIWNSHGRSTFSMAYGLANRGYDVSVFTFTSKEETYKMQDGQVTIYYIGGVVDDKKITTLPFDKIELWNERMLPLLLCEDFDTLMLNNWHGWEAAKRYGKARIISVVPFLYSFTGWLKPLSAGLENVIRKLESDFLVNSHTLVAHTNKFAQKLASYCDKPVFVLPNCHLDMSDSYRQVKQKINNQVCFVGRVNKEKNLERIIRVMPSVPDMTLVIASSYSTLPGYSQTLDRLARSYDVEHRITVKGWMPTKEVRDLYLESSLAIVTSQFEPYGYSVLDPMALGTPVIVSEWSYLDEYLQSQEHVFSSLDSLTEKIKGVLGKKAHTELIATNKELVKTIFSEDYITSQLESIILG